MGDEESTTFVKVCTSRDQWARSGWCLETLYHRSGTREVVLEKVSPPRREVRIYHVWYRCMVITYSKSMDQPGKVANPARGKLDRENEYSSVRVRA